MNAQVVNEENQVGFALSDEEISSYFVEPYPQPALDGEMGLTLHDLAQSLQIPAERLSKKVRRGKIPEMLNMLKLQNVPYGMMNKNGVLTESYVFSADAAELIVAKYENAIGWKYAAYLINCRKGFQVAKQAYFTLLDENQDLKKQTAAYEKPYSRKVKGKGEVKYFPYLDKTVSMFKEVGAEYVKRTRKQVRSEMTKSEHNAYSAQHISKVIAGGMNRINKIMEEEDCDDVQLRTDVKIANDVIGRIRDRINRPDLKEVPLEDAPVASELALVAHKENLCRSEEKG